MNIFAVAVNVHDHNTFNGEFHNQIERHTRIKHNLNKLSPQDPTLSRTFFKKHFVPNYKNKSIDIFAFSVSNLGQQLVSELLDQTLPNKDFLQFKPKSLWDYYQTKTYYYIDHHQSHAAYAFLSSRFTESDILAIDGKGWQFTCIFVDKYGAITDLSEKISIGGLWNRLSQDIGFGYLNAGKVMGLVGSGKFNEDISSMIYEYLKNPNHQIPSSGQVLLSMVPREDVAYTLQQVTIELIRKYVYPLKTSDNICVAGGVAYNGYLNEELTSYYKSVHVPPAVGDEGQSIGTYMHADYVLNKNINKYNAYLGQEYTVDESIFAGLNFEKKEYNAIYSEVANAISKGAIVAWYQGKSESGNRALGNRSILADPRNPGIKDIINSRIKMREDFRPFAPSVLEEYYHEYFDTTEPSPFMSRIVKVISDKIPGVTHVDQTSRIQTVTEEFNEKFYRLIHNFYLLTGIPMLLNTSFNCQEPIVETPADAIATFKKCDLDILVINNYIIRKLHD
jgi:carbamoyltransferase